MSVLKKCFHLIWPCRKSNQEKIIARLRKTGAVIGDGTRFMGGGAYLGSEPYLVEIGNDCLISANVHFFTHDGGVKVLNSAGFFPEGKMDKMARIKIGNNCFIGNGAYIMPGVQICDNVIVGALSVVTKNVPSGVVVAGMPAKVICSIEEYYKKNLERGVFYPTVSMSPEEKRKYLIKNVPELKILH